MTAETEKSTAPAGRTTPTEQLDTDYSILGAGAMGMGFADVILAGDPGACIVIVDRYANPGGHWNDAYPFVRLHQPALFYGLNSTNPGQGGADPAPYGEILGYYKARWTASRPPVGCGFSRCASTSRTAGWSLWLTPIEPPQSPRGGGWWTVRK